MKMKQGRVLGNRTNNRQSPFFQKKALAERNFCEVVKEWLRETGVPRREGEGVQENPVQGTRQNSGVSSVQAVPAQ